MAPREAPRSAAHLTHYSWTGMSAPLINLARVLRERGYTNTLYRGERELVHSEHISRISATAPFDRVHVHDLDIDLGLFMNQAVRLCGMSDVDRIGVDFVRKRRALISEQLLIGYDHFGAAMAWFSSRFRRARYVVFSLELSEERRPSRWERLAWRNAVAVITFDSIRARIVEQTYDLTAGSCICVPNTNIGGTYEFSSDSLRSRLHVPDNKHVVLMVGSLIPEHCFHEVMMAVPSWPESFALVIHGWGMNGPDREIFDRISRQCPKRMFFSDHIFPQEEKQNVYAGTDVGIVAYTDKTINHRFAGASAGKLFDFCQAGVPVLANDLPGMRELVEGNSIGRVVGNFEGIGETLCSLVAERAGYERRCHRFFERNEFRSRMTAALDTIGL